MSDTSTLVREHYGAQTSIDQDWPAQLIDLFDGASQPLSPEAFAGIDQFHVGGLTATRELAKLMGVERGMRVLDAGSGLGGPSRVVAKAYGCHVTGVDLTPSFVAVSRLFADRTGLVNLVRYHVGDLLALDFADAQFDAAFSQHVVMNIPDRDRVCREIRRVLKPGARFGFYDVLASEHKPAPHYPLPWAETPSVSTLLTQDETRDALLGSGLVPYIWKDVTVEAMGWAAQQQAAAPVSRFNLGMVMGPRMADMATNLMRSLREGRVQLVMAVCTAR